MQNGLASTQRDSCRPFLKPGSVSVCSPWGMRGCVDGREGACGTLPLRVCRWGAESGELQVLQEFQTKRVLEVSDGRACHILTPRVHGDGGTDLMLLASHVFWT